MTMVIFVFITGTAMTLKSIFTNEKILLTLVLINVIFIFVGGFYDYSYPLVCVDSFFTLLFLAEAIVKINDKGWDEYWSDNWNKFDFIVTIVALPSLINLFGSFGAATNVALTFRVMRVFKSFRLFEFIPNINTVLKGIILAVKASLVVALGFVVLLLIVSILTTTIFGSIVPEYFGDPASSLYSTFRLFSIEGWYEIPDAIAERTGAVMSTFAKLYFSVMLFVGGVLGMSLINAIFVDAAVSDNNDDVKKQLDTLEKKIDSLTKALEAKEKDQ